MIKYFCDFCGKELTEDETFVIWIVRHWNNEFIEELGHICNECLEKLEENLEKQKILEEKNV